ncbi:hypothetical protein FNV43_RR09127 [Rhamnella rubrinervis]|uniref:Uncharacterized protein n=1 Tax=Rhamnella rubrinervis TaxID=2594499 RepID=A0A8K0MJH2_9ROSA|nr:hypothetical protein FNV43_RR09127 [Rhamnella rubrinervis]
MKLVWSPEMASKAYIDTVKSCEIFHESGVAELVSAMAAGWNAKFIVETWSQGGPTATSVGLAVASCHTGARHVCIVPDERSRSEYVRAMNEADMSPEVIVGEPEEVMDRITDIDFLVVDSKRKDFARVLRLAKLSCKGAVLVCKNASWKGASGFRWRSVTDGGSRRLVRSVFLPVGKGLDMAHVGSNGGASSSGKGEGRGRWVKHVDQRSGEEHVIRK